MRAVKRTCPNEGKPCFCSGVCQTIYVRDDDPRTDEQVRTDAGGMRPITWGSV